MEFIDSIDHTISQSTLDDFRQFLSIHDKQTKWVICSDYCVNDRNKPNDVISFVIIPNIFGFNKWQATINSIQKTDIKNTRFISEEFCKFTHSGLIFGFDFVFEKMYLNEQFPDVNVSRDMVDSFINQVCLWKPRSEKMENHYNEMLKGFKSLKYKMNEKSFNLKLFGQMVMTSLLAGYLRYLLIKESESAEVIGWLSDRDSITSYCGGVYTYIYELLGYCLCANNLHEEKYVSVTDALPKNPDNMFYDEYVRIADILCGIIADYDFERNTNSKMKHHDGVEKIMAENRFLSVIRIKKDKTIRRVEFLCAE